MLARKVLVGILTVIMASPAWGGAEALGNVTSSSVATIRDTILTPGSTVFSGDEIAVDAHGAALVALTNGAQAEILSNSAVRLTKSDNRIQMLVERGQASFRTSEGKDITALVADATVRPASGADTSAIVESLSATHAIVAAEKGALLLTTAHDGKVYTVPEGEAAELTAAADPQQDGTPVPAGKSAPTLSSPSKKRVVYWTVAIVGAGVIITAVLLVRRETKPSTTSLQNEISPATLY